ncbi:hypothetical protein H4R18_003227 [Coemansia javaensis]|uniref:Kinase n=1 Tax=Coemansia javaensis TaxID=2761396 RepID=A0A9W8HB09_9FUNG|nr:hypothetical protein H4R18_003227 [Coemansia javaensis]
MSTEGEAARGGAEQVREFEHQVAGHRGMLAVEGDEMIIKPLAAREHQFYEGAAQHPGLRAFMPVYYGALRRTDPDSGEERGYICLENLVHGFEQPCIMDVKVGRRLWDVDATDEKRARAIQQAARKTSAAVGFAITGIKLHGRPAEDRERLRDLGVAALPAELERYFAAAGEHRAHIVEQFVLEATELLEAVEAAEVRMYSCSLLFVYDASRERCALALGGGGGGGDGAAASGGLLDLRLIDFGHSHWMPPGAGRDENFIDGLRSVIEYLRGVGQGRHQGAGAARP